MNAPWYRKRKFNVALFTAFIYTFCILSGDPMVAEGLLKIGLMLMAAIAAEDFGKARYVLIQIEPPIKPPKNPPSEPPKPN